MEQRPRTPQNTPLTPDEINNKIKEKVSMLLVPEEGEILNKESYALITHRIINRVREQPLTHEALDAILKNPEVQEDIIKATLVRLETDTNQPGAYVYDSNGHVIKRIKNLTQMGETARGQREAA